MKIKHPWCTRAQVDAGCKEDLVFGDPKAPRFVFWEKKLRATPSGPDALTFDLLSFWGKIRAGLGAIGAYKTGPMPGTQRATRTSLEIALTEVDTLIVHLSIPAVLFLKQLLLSLMTLKLEV